jgi:tetratricopeptide (TPR) repeat protein
MFAFGGVAFAGDLSRNNSLREGWKLLGGLQGEPAKAIFEQVPDDDEARLGAALSYLALQPWTAGNANAAEALLSEMIRNPGGNFRPEAFYYYARIPQIHRDPSNNEEALRRYERLISEHPKHRLAELARLKAAILRLYAVDDGEAPLQKFETLFSEGKSLNDPDVIRDYYRILADAAAYYELGDEKTYECLKRMDETGRTSGSVRIHLLARLGELARLTGRPDEAIGYYEQFLAEFPNNDRAMLVRQHLARLKNP